MGKVMMSGIVPQLKNPAVSVSELAVGSSVFLNINGSPTEFIIVNHGIPSESLIYDTSCDGTWLMMKNCYAQKPWNVTGVSGMNNYRASGIHIWLNDGFLALFDAAVKNAIKQVKVPYGYPNSVAVHEDADGVPAKVFLLSGCEMGIESFYYSSDGALLDYFRTDAVNRRRATYNGAFVNVWTRSAYTQSSVHVLEILTSGSESNRSSEVSQGIRPAIVLPSNAVVNDNGTITFE